MSWHTRTRRCGGSGSPGPGTEARLKGRWKLAAAER
uniref:Uncharacterized protein n=1 Tax=Arundo donax TaxID=35708 RepID=A0A0A9FZH4_ARUDO